jgi:CrcB protein
MNGWWILSTHLLEVRDYLRVKPQGLFSPNFKMKLLLLIGTGSFVGGITRYLLSQVIQNRMFSTFPYGTLVVNISGCFLIGLIFGLSERGNMNVEWRLFLATGILGGFTTFSAFSNESVAMIRDGQWWQAMAYISMSVFVGLLATFTGLSLIKLF